MPLPYFAREYHLPAAADAALLAPPGWQVRRCWSAIASWDPAGAALHCHHDYDDDAGFYVRTRTADLTSL